MGNIACTVNLLAASIRTICLVRFRHLFIGGTGIGAMACALSVAISQETEIPIPKKGKTAAVKGEPLEIKLESIARTRASTVEFLVREHPKNGKILEMVSDPKDRTSVKATYLAERGTAATSDSFTFAVRYYPNGTFSKEVKYEIELEESEPFVTITSEADFGNVMLGDSEVKELFLRNSGKAAYQRKLELPQPWSISEPLNGFVSLPIGGTASIKVRFSPREVGPFEYPFTVNPNQGGSSRLVGTGFAPFSLKTEEVFLNWEKNSRARIGEIKLEIHSPKVMPVAIRSTDSRVLVDGGINQMIVPGREFATRIYLPAGDSLAYEGIVEVAAGAFKLPIMVAAGAPPAYVEVDTGSPTGQPTIDFGTLQPGGITQKGFVVRNVGGGETKVRFTSEEPFQVLAAGGSATLSAGENEAFAIRFQAPEGAQDVFNGLMSITADTGQMVQVRLRAVSEMAASESNDPPASAFQNLSSNQSAVPTPNPNHPPAPPTLLGPEDQPPDSLAHVGEFTEREQLDALRSPLGFVTVPLVERDISPATPSIPEAGMKFESNGQHHVTVSWSLPRSDLIQFEIERRGNRENPKTFAIESVWVPYQDVDYQQKDGRMFATIRGLNPNELSEFRVFTLGAEGKVSKPVSFVSDTSKPMDWTWIYLGLGLLLVLGAGAVIWKFLTARRIQSDDGFYEFG